MVLAFILLHFAPSIYWGASGDSIIAPLLWSLVGAAYSAIAKWRSRHEDLMSAFALATGKRRSMLLCAALTGLLTSGVLNLAGYFIGWIVASSSGATKAVEAIVFAYLIAGLHHVLCDLRRPTIGRPAYIRQGSSSVASVMLGVLVWISVSTFNLRWARGLIFWDTVFDLVLFGAMTCALLLI
jgi:hypothetical protein